MTHGDGQDSVPTTKFFLTASPNLQDNEGISFLFLDFTLQWDNIRTQMNVLVSKDHPLDAGAKQDNRTKIWMQGVKDITVTLRCTVHHICLVPRSMIVSVIVSRQQIKDTNKWRGRDS